jgi:DNA-directed RNA polymerase subunit M/transcription elongation factor TFIIS
MLAKQCSNCGSVMIKSSESGIYKNGFNEIWFCRNCKHEIKIEGGFE